MITITVQSRHGKIHSLLSGSKRPIHPPKFLYIRDIKSCMSTPTFSHTGHLRAHAAGLGVRAGVHELWSVHHAGVPEGEVWGTENPDLPLLSGTPPLRLHQNIGESPYHSYGSREYNR